jgi:hypothetical protein
MDDEEEDTRDNAKLLYSLRSLSRATDAKNADVTMRHGSISVIQNIPPGF